MKLLFLSLPTLIFLSACQDEKNDIGGTTIARGQMPNVAKDHAGNFHLVYGNGDSIFYSYSADRGSTFSTPKLISVLPKLAASHMRGPQIAAISDDLIVSACNDLGDIFSFSKSQSGKWMQSGRVNDIDTVAKENLMALAADEKNAFAVWLDLRSKHNQIYGARSTDGGKNWSKNNMIYSSPDTTVCECCKPSVVVKGNNVYVMFRNWLNGNRDMYLIQSSDEGLTFDPAQKLGIGSWPLNGCPMDGGGIAVNNNGSVETVWNRKGLIYACEPGKEEKELGKGRNCTIETVNGKTVYAWVEGGEIIVLKPRGMKKNLGRGQLPTIKAINNEHILCIWENDKQIHKTILEL